MGIDNIEKFISGTTKLGLSLNLRQLEQFSTYYKELVDWNRRMNLTRITSYQEVLVKHFLDSLTVTLAFKQPLAGGGFSVIDVGTGAGLPGIPLKPVSFLGKEELHFTSGNIQDGKTPFVFR